MLININNFDPLYWENSVTWNSYKIHMSLRIHGHVLKYRVILNSRVKVVDIGSWINSYKVIFYNIISYYEKAKNWTEENEKFLQQKSTLSTLVNALKVCPGYLSIAKAKQDKKWSRCEKNTICWTISGFRRKDLQKVFEN